MYNSSGHPNQQSNGTQNFDQTANHQNTLFSNILFEILNNKHILFPCSEMFIQLQNKYSICTILCIFFLALIIGVHYSYIINSLVGHIIYKTRHMSTAILTRQSTTQDQKQAQMINPRLVYKKQVGELKVDETTPFYKDFDIQGNVITYGEPFKTYYSQLLIDWQIPKKCIFKFRFRIVRSVKGQIFIGITNRRQYKDVRTSHQLKGSFSYFGRKQLTWPDRHHQGEGFGKAGDIVEVKIDRITGQIFWSVNGKEQAKRNSTQLIHNQYVPSVQMHQKYDSIEWLGVTIQ